MKKILLSILCMAALMLASSCTQIVKPDSDSTMMNKGYTEVEEEEEKKSGTKLTPKITICKKLQVVFSRPK